MKVTLIVDVEFQVTEEANRIGSSEKVVWARFSGLFSFPSLPRIGEVIKIWPLGDDDMAILEVENVEHVFDGQLVFNPTVFTEYVIPSEGYDFDTEMTNTNGYIKNISDWLIKHGFSVSKPISYSFRY
jgi:hypothetical protein